MSVFSKAMVQLKIRGFVSAEEGKTDLGGRVMVSVAVIEWGLEPVHPAWLCCFPAVILSLMAFLSQPSSGMMP